MSGRGRFFATCVCGKLGYETRKAAKAAGRLHDTTMHVYQCSQSDLFHLTSRSAAQETRWRDADHRAHLSGRSL